jgi:hypothetical protein
MNNEILIGIGGLLLSALTYFAGVIRTKRQLSDRGREERINRVLDAYMSLRRMSRTSGLDGLQQAGAATLQSHAEVVEVGNRIVSHGEAHPLGREHATVFAGVNLLRFFQYAAQNRINLFSVPVERVINDSGARENE